MKGAMMKITFYGTRGSIPVPEQDFVQFGGNTPCVLITFSTGRVAILDAGTGIRKLGDDLLAASHEQYDDMIIGLSHTHWDHIQGFPFFKLANDPRRHITLAICGNGRTTKDLESIFATQMQDDYFPVSLDKIGAKLTFWQPDVTEYNHPRGINIVASKYNHPGGAYGYRITEGNKTVVYCTDVEHMDGIDPNVVALSRNADLLIHDAQYTTDELKEKRGWGHSSWEQAVEVAKQAEVKRLALFHHDPEHSDDFLLDQEMKCHRRFPMAFFAREGTEIMV
jgi:phosphoribosyl 1,2-cyclic phosphodiesterase